MAQSLRSPTTAFGRLSSRSRQLQQQYHHQPSSIISYDFSSLSNKKLHKNNGEDPSPVVTVCQTKSSSFSSSSSSSFLMGISSSCTISKSGLNIQQSFSLQSYFSSTHKARKTRKISKKAKATAPSLKSLSGPFLMLCHPDRLGNMAAPLAKEINLKAVQTLNGLWDSLETILDPTQTTITLGRRTIEDIVKEVLEIEFVLPSSRDDITASSLDNDENGDDDWLMNNSSGNRTHDRKYYSRRSVELYFPSDLIRHVMNPTTATSSSSSFLEEQMQQKKARIKLRRHALGELSKLLRVAGLSLSEDLQHEIVSLEEQIHHNDNKTTQQNNANVDVDEDDDGIETWDTADYILRHELDINNEQQQSQQSRRRGQRRRGPMTAYEKSREKFMRTFDWDRLRRMNEKVAKDMEADEKTSGLIKNNPQRRQNLIASIVSKIRVHDVHQDNNHDATTTTTTTTAAAAVVHRDVEADLGPIHQLIAIRRITLLLEDHFDSLQMEEMGRMWENLTIVLTPSSISSSSSSSSFKNQKNDNNSLSRYSSFHLRQSSSSLGSRHLRKSSGFKFAFGIHGTVTVYIPVDFKDNVLLREFERNLNDFQNIFYADDIENDLWMFPKHLRAVMR